MTAAGDHKRKWSQHGHSKSQAVTPTYRAWLAMHQRCYNPNAPRFPWYGAKGINVVARWHSYPNFLADMGERPFKGARIGRYNDDGDYGPHNVKWMSAQDQMAEKRKFKQGLVPQAFTPDEDES